MQQRISFVTLGVHNLNMMKNWYCDKFGWTIMKDGDDICFFKLSGFILALFPAQSLAEDIGVAQDGFGFKRFTLAINLRSKQEVDQFSEELKSQGVHILREPEQVYWGGYRGYIADPENNYWELAYNPFLEMDGQGNIL